MSENIQKKKRITVFDIFIVAAIVAVIAYVLYTLVVVPMQNRGVARQIEFTVEMTATTKDIVDLVQVGDIVTITNRPSGEVVKVEAHPAQKSAVDYTTGNYVMSTIPGRYDLFVTVAADANETAKEITAVGTPIRIGTMVSVEGQGYSVSGYVLDMRFTDEAGSVGGAVGSVGAVEADDIEADEATEAVSAEMTEAEEDGGAE